MPEAALALVVIALLVERFFHEKTTAEERQRLVNAVLAKTPIEFKMLNDQPKPLPHVMPEPTPLDGYEGIAGLGG